MLPNNKSPDMPRLPVSGYPRMCQQCGQQAEDTVSGGCQVIQIQQCEPQTGYNILYLEITQSGSLAARYIRVT